MEKNGNHLLDNQQNTINTINTTSTINAITASITITANSSINVKPFLLFTFSLLSVKRFIMYT